nr:MAG TPA: hypothetical protein [Caudoviricetes sp.]
MNVGYRLVGLRFLPIELRLIFNHPIQNFSVN